MAQVAVARLSTTEWLVGAKFAYALLTVLVATLASAAVVTLRFSKRKRAANSTSAATVEPISAASDADPHGTTCGQLLPPNLDPLTHASKASPPPSLARSCLVATSRPHPYDTTAPSSTPAPRKQPAKSCWKYSFSRSFCSVAASAALPPTEGKENVALLPSKHGVTSRLFERMCKRRKKENAAGSPPNTPPALAGNKHNLAALPASQQSPKKPKMMLPSSAPSFGSPISDVLQALPCDPNTPHPLRTAPGSPAPARLHFSVPPVLSSSAPTLSYMPTFTPGSSPSSTFSNPLFPFPPPLLALSSLPTTSPFTPASLPPRPPPTNPFPLPTPSAPTAFASPFTPASSPPSNPPPLAPSPSPPHVHLHFSPPPPAPTSLYPTPPPHLSIPSPDPTAAFPHAISLPALTIPPTPSPPSPPHPSPTSTPAFNPPSIHPDPLYTQLMALMPTFQAQATPPPLPPTPPPAPADGNTRAGSKRRTEGQTRRGEEEVASEGADEQDAAEQPLKRKGGRGN